MELDTPTSKAIARFLAERQRDRASTDLNKMKRLLRQTGHAITEVDFQRFWHGLEEEGAGALKDDMFKWNTSLKATGRSLIGKALKRSIKPPVSRAHVLHLVSIKVPTKWGEALISIPESITRQELKIVTGIIENSILESV